MAQLTVALTVFYVAGFAGIVLLLLKFAMQTNYEWHPVLLPNNDSVQWSSAREEITKRRKSFNPLTHKEINEVQTFVFFLGYRRSGHSIIGSMMDAHPKIVIAHEFGLFASFHQRMLKNKALLFNALYRDSFIESTKGRRTSQNDWKGYTLELKSSWQGKFDELKIIGDKAGGATTNAYTTSPTTFLKNYRQLAHTVKVPIKVIHVIRNPYDMIATETLYSAGMHGKASPTAKFDNQSLMKQSEKFYFRLIAGVQMLKRNFPMKILEIHSEDFIRDPKKVIRGICSFLDVECPIEYVQECYDKAFKTVSRSRDLVVWDPAMLARVKRNMQKYPFISGYSFKYDFPK